MNARLESMSHGDGKVYLQMVLDRLRPNSEVLLDAYLKDGKRIPSHLYSFIPVDSGSSANYVVVLPHFDVREVNLHFAEYSDDGSLLSRCRLSVEINMMRLRTRFNTLVHNELINQMFDIEREYCANRITVFFTDAIEDDDEIIVKMYVDMPHIKEADVVVDFLDRRGQEIDLSVYPLFDVVVPSEQFGDSERLHVGFSVRVHADNKDFCAVVYDAYDLVPGGFAQFCDETYESLHESFLQTMTDASQDEDYAVWYRHHCETLAGLASQRTAQFAHQPLISLALPLFAEDTCYLAAMLASLSQQSYTNFELVVVDCGVSQELFEHSFRNWIGDSRFLHIEGSADLSEASARLTGLLQSSGEVCAVLDPRIILAPEALFEYVRTLNQIESEQDSEVQNNERALVCDVAYSNHDFFDRKIGFHDPQIKPVYSPDLLYSYSYMGPLVFISREMINTISREEGFSTDAFDYDLALKATAKAHRVERIDKVLYHVQDAACISAEAETVAARREEEAFRLGRKALGLHLKRQRVDAVVWAELSDRVYRVQYRLPELRPSLSIIISIKDEVELLDACLSSLVEHDTLDRCEIVIVDNGSREEFTKDYLRDLDTKLPHVRILTYHRPYGPAEVASIAARTCTSDFLLFLDNGTELVTDGGISTLLAHCMRRDCGVVGAKLLYPDDTIQHAGMMVGAYGSSAPLGVNMARSATGYAKRFLCASNLSAVSSATMMVKRSVFVKIGGFDERFKLTCHDADFCLRVNKEGYRVVFRGDIEFYHQGDAAGGSIFTTSEMLRAEREQSFFRYRWARLFLKGDPYFSSCFDSDSPYFRLK